MQKQPRGRATKVGLPPGSLVHIGRRPAGPLRITLIDYTSDTLQERTVTDIGECFAFKDSDSVTWLNVEGVHDPELLGGLGSCFNLHPLVVEDIMNTDQRPKIEDYGEYCYAVLKMLRFDEALRVMTSEQVSIILGQRYVLSFQEGAAGDVFNPIRERLKNDKSRIRRMGNDYLAYALIDAIVDHYFVVLEHFGERIETVEDELISRPMPATLQALHELKREMLYLRKSVWPLREVVGSLQRSESELISDATRIYLKDVYDHAIHAIDTIETYREMLSGMLDIYLSSVSNRLNQVMKVLTIIATIFMPLTFLAGVYGMNFKHMPELEWVWSYPLLWIVMIAIAIGMLIMFRRKQWL